MELEARYWFSKPRDGEILIIVTGGEFKSWEEIRDRLLPAALRTKLGSEPLWIPLQHRCSKILADPSDQKLRGQLIEDLKQVFLRLYSPRTWEELQGEERAHLRRALWMTSAAMLAFLALSIAALRFGFDAQKQSKLAQQRQQEAETARDAETKARDAETKARRQADANAEAANRQERLAKEETAVAQRNARESNARELATYAKESLGEDPERSILLGMYAAIFTVRFREPPLPAAEDVLHQAILSSRVRLTLRGHTGPVRDGAFSPDGKRLVTASYDGTAKVWDAESGKELLTLRGHSDGVYSVAFSPDGMRVATASGDGTAKVWDAGSGQEMLTLRGHSGAVDGVAFSPVGKRLATASGDGTAKVWDAWSGQELLTLRGHSDTALDVGFTGVAFSPDGKRLATASDDKTAKVWDAMSGQELLTLRGTQALLMVWCSARTASAWPPPVRTTQ
jgi:hypothetical protein